MFRNSQQATFQRISVWVSASPVRAYGLAVLITLTAYLVRVGLAHSLDARPTFSIFSFGVLATAVLCGVRPAILAMVLSAVVVNVFILEPTGTLSFNPRDLVDIVLFVIIASGMIGLARLATAAAEHAETALVRQRQLGDRLQAEEATQRAILATIPDAMVVIDAKGVIQSFSSAAETLFGYAAAEVCGKNVKMLMPQPFREEHDGYIERFRRTGEARIIGRGRRVTALKKDGTTFPMDLAVGEANVAGSRTFVGFIRDLTAKLESERHLQSLQSELLHASRLNAMGEMSAALAHELNQPLTAIANYAKAARRTLSLGAEKIEDAQSMMDKTAAQAIRAGEIIKRLREFVEHREVTRTIETPAKVVEEAMALGVVDAAESGVRVKTQFDDATPQIYIDKVQIQQVLVNLMRNAIEAMQSVEVRDLSITVSLAEGNAAEIAICDTGPGLAPEVAGRLFQPFVTTKKSGMGVGLSICQSILQAHNGRIWVTTNAGAGITFHVSLPAAGTEA